MSTDSPVFTLSYDTELEDLTEMARKDAHRRMSRQRAALSVPGWILIVGLFTALPVALSRPSPTGQGTPIWMYVIATVGWLWILFVLGIVWRLSPAARGRRLWRTRPTFHGPHREEVSQAGILALAPGQPSVFYPWPTLSAIDETTRAFYVSARPGGVVVLPKRGLPDASLIPELRQFLHQAVAAGADQAAGTADQAAATD